MTDTALPRELALRVALAARQMPGSKPADILDILGDAIGFPLTVTKLDGLTVKMFRKAGGESVLALPADDIKAAVAILKGKDGSNAGPEPQDYSDGDMPGSLRVACASNGGELLDGHFGSCTHFLIYQVSTDEVRLIDVRQVPKSADDETLDAEADKNKQRASLISDCQILYVVSIGGPPVAKVVRAGIHPIKRPNGGNAREIAGELSAVLQGAPPPWLAKVLGHDPEQRVRFEMEDLE